MAFTFSAFIVALSHVVENLSSGVAKKRNFDDGGWSGLRSRDLCVMNAMLYQSELSSHLMDWGDITIRANVRSSPSFILVEIHIVFGVVSFLAEGAGVEFVLHSRYDALVPGGQLDMTGQQGLTLLISMLKTVRNPGPA